MNRLIWVHLALLFVTMLYGGNYTVAKYALPDYIRPVAFISIRLLSGTVLFWAIGSLSPRTSISRQDHWLLFRCGLFGAALNQLLFFEGLSLTTPIHASIMMTMSPIAVILIAALIFISCGNDPNNTSQDKDTGVSELIIWKFASISKPLFSILPIFWV